MSLVCAYSDSEDEENGQENEEVKKICKSENTIKNDRNNTEILKSDENNEITSSSEIVDEDETWVDNVKHTAAEQSSFFAKLPKPQKDVAVVEEEDDEFLKIKPVKEKEKLSRVVEESEEGSKEPAVKKKKKIMIPLPVYQKNKDSDDNNSADEAADTQPKKKAPQAAGKSSLFTMLPKPKHSIVVRDNKNKAFQRQSNRMLLPHKLRKDVVETAKNSVVSTVTKKTNNKASLVADAESSSDDDDNDGEASTNFFSFGSSDKPEEASHEITKITKIKESVVSSTVPLSVPSGQPVSTDSNQNNGSKDDAKSNNSKSNDYFKNLFKPNDKKAKPNQSSGSFKETKVVQKEISNSVSTAPQNTHSNVTVPYSKATGKATYSDVTAPYGEVTAPYGQVAAPYGEVTAPYGEVTAPYGNATNSNVMAPYGQSTTLSYGGNYSTINHAANSAESNFFAYDYKQSATGEPTTQTQDGKIDYYNQSNYDTLLDKDALKALVGGNRKRKQEEIDIIDIHGKDIQASSNDYLKNLTEESGYKPSSKKDEPRKQEKRKHQITYLAHQAKEREFELQQAWASSRQTKRDTQSKYGF